MASSPTRTSAPAAPTSEGAVRSRSAARAPSRAPAQPSLSNESTRAGVSTLTMGLGPGQPLPEATRAKLEQGFGADLRSLRVHQGPAATQATRRIGARAFTSANKIVLGAGESPNDVELMAHEVTHTLQQGQAARRFTRNGGGPFEREAQHAAMVVAQGGTVNVMAGAGAPGVQLLGLQDALDFFAERAYAIPGYRMFTIVLGLNPINMGRVERSAANILRAVVEFIPGGNLITLALDQYGIFDRVGGWVDEQIRALGVSGASIRRALDQFLDSLSWTDIFNLGGVWERAKRIFSEPIDRIVTTVRSAASAILRFIKDAILMPLARLAEGTRGYPLLKAVLGRDPITGEAFPRNAETLIGGFMKLIGQEEVWTNLQRSRAVPRAWAWFQGTLEGLLGFVREIPGLFVQTLRDLELSDIILVPRAFIKVGRVFAGFLGRFVTWGGTQVLSLLQIIFEVVAPAAMPYLQRAAGAFRTIVRDPIGFIRNLVRAGIQGLRQFAGNFLTHLRASLIGWLTGAMSGANIHIPQSFSLVEILKFVLSVLGLTWQNIRTKLVRLLGETAVSLLETGFQLVVTFVREGPAAAWQQLSESLGNLREMVMEQIMAFVRDRVIQAAITRLVTSLNPAGAFIQAVLAIYNTIMFFVERLQQIAQVAASVIDSLAAIASGVIGAAADRVERTMAGLLTLVISFLARIAGLGRVTDAVTSVIDRIRRPIDRALDRVVEWIRNAARGFLSRLLGGDPRATPQQRVERATDEGAAAVNRLSGSAIGEAVMRPVLATIRARHNLTQLVAVREGNLWVIEGTVNPRKRKPTQKQAATGAGGAGSAGTTRETAFEIEWPKRRLSQYEPVWLVPRAVAKGKVFSQAALQNKEGAQLFRPASRVSLFDGPTIGVSATYRTRENKIFGPAPFSRPSTPNLESFKELFKRHGYDREKGSDGITDADHVSELQMVGAPGDTYENLWPLNYSENRSSGSTLSTTSVTLADGRSRHIRDLARSTYYFKIKRFKL